MENPSTSKGRLVTISNSLCGEARQKKKNKKKTQTLDTGDNQKGGEGMVSCKGFFWGGGLCKKAPDIIQ